jgi:hypothetical protein
MPRGARWLLGAAALALATPLIPAQEKEKPTLSEKTSEALRSLQPLLEKKDNNGILAKLDETIAAVPPTSYDAAYLLEAKARTLANAERYSDAVVPWEQSLKLAEQYGYFDDAKMSEIMRFVAQILFMDAAALKDKAQQQQQITRAGQYLKRYLDKAGQPGALHSKTETQVYSDMQLFYAQVLAYQATLDSKNVNRDLLEQARKIVEQAMHSSIHPKESAYVLLLSILQQEEDYKTAADVLELTLKLFPNKKDLWPSLMSTYNTLANETKDEKERQMYFVRAINAIERAQQLGLMKQPRENLILVSIYINAGQASKASELLYNGMKSGAIESTVNNWRILAAQYQAANKDLQAIAALDEAAKLFPKDGIIDFQIGIIYQQLDKMKEARDHYQRAVSKGSLGEKPHQVYVYLAFADFDLEDYSGALKAITEAEKFPDAKKDPQVPRLKKGIEDTIKERELNKAAREAAAKKL